MFYYLVDVLSTVVINGKENAFDYINTYIDRDKALNEAKSIASLENTVKVSVHKWYMDENGHQDICEGTTTPDGKTDDIIFFYQK